MLWKSANVCLLLAVAHAAALPSQRHDKQHCPYTRLVVFGDSFSDNGSGAWIASNETWPADPAYYNHTFSNGPVWPDYLATTLNVPLLDYATGGATADNSYITGYTGPHSTIKVPSAYDQVRRFLRESAPKDTDLFVHLIGANDAFFNTSVSAPKVTSLIKRDIDILLQAGAKTILLANYPPINLFPATHASPEYAFGPAYAKALKSGLNQLIADYKSFAKIASVDVEALFAEIFAHPGAYGIDKKYVDPPTGCLQGSYPSQGVARSLCDDPERHLFFDIYHPVTKVHSRIAGLCKAALDRF